MNKKPLTIGSLKSNPKTVKKIVEPTQIRQPKKDKIKKPMVKFVHYEKNYEVEILHNETLLDSALRQSVPMKYKCKKGKCGKCLVQILTGKEYLSGPASIECDKLSSQIEKGYRLSCQATPI